MKQGSLDVDRLKSEGRHCFHRRKMLKNSPLLNGDSENKNVNCLGKEFNYAVCVSLHHDHLSCAKASPQELCSSDTKPKEVRLSNLPIETDHIYASEIKNKSNVANHPSTPQEISSNELIEVDRKNRERRMCLLRKRHSKQTIEAPSNNVSNESQSEPKLNNTSISSYTHPTGNRHTSLSTPVLATRYFGRRSKTVPSRALKRRYLGPPKTLPIKRELFTNMPSPVLSSTLAKQVSSISETPTANDSSPVSTKVHKKRGRRPKKVSEKCDHLTTDNEYFLPDNQTSPHSPSTPQIDVPLWKYKPVTSFYQMEGTENINDIVFQRRHMKCELDEKRRKRWDMQRLREQKASQKLKYKNSRAGGKDGENELQLKFQSFYPDPKHIEYIEVADTLPVIAFGRVIPLFQSSEFSLPWCNGQNLNSESVPNVCKGKKGRQSNQGTKVT